MGAEGTALLFRPACFRVRWSCVGILAALLTNCLCDLGPPPKRPEHQFLYLYNKILYAQRSSKNLATLIVVKLMSISLPVGVWVGVVESKVCSETQTLPGPATTFRSCLAGSRVMV